MMHAPMGQVGPPMHPGMPPQQPPPPAQPSQVQAIELKFDNVNKVKSLIRTLKESFANVMHVAGARVDHMSQMSAGKTVEETPPRFDKILEDYFSICNQVELYLKAIQECTLQHKDSAQYLPLSVPLGKQDSSGVGTTADGHPCLSYTQYVGTIKMQAHFARTIQEILAGGARKVVES